MSEFEDIINNANGNSRQEKKPFDKEAWIKRLLDRYDRTGLEKDINALTNCVRSYSDQIDALERNNFFTHRIVLEDINYALDNEIDNVVWSEQQ